MKIRLALTAAAFASLAGAALAHDTGARVYTETYLVPVPAAPITRDSAIHSGSNNIADQLLADRVAAALAADRLLQTPAGFVVTVSAKDGRVALAGNAANAQQAARAEKIASDIAGRSNVSGTLDISAGG